MAGINGIRALFTGKQLQNIFETFQNDVENKMLLMLQYIGEQFVNKARLSGNYKDRTGNLRSSIGYIILKDGNVIDKNFAGNQEGVSKGQQVANEVALQYPQGWVLIGVAGMEYAAYVEAKNFDVISGSAPTKAMFKDILSEV